MLPADAELDDRKYLPETERMDAQRKLRNKFGSSVSFDLVAKAAGLVDTLAAAAETAGVSRSLLVSSSTSAAVGSGPLFGTKIKFAYEPQVPLGTLIASVVPLRMQQESGRNGSKAPQQQRPGGGSLPAADHAAAGTAKTLSMTTNDSGWLKMTIEKAFAGSDVSVEGMVHSVFELLASAKDNDLLQNELFELVGFERFELIGTLLQHRIAVVSSVMVSLPAHAEAAAAAGHGSSAPHSGANGTGSRSAPSVSSSVTIQSAEHRKAEKKRRKEEKRAASKQASAQPDQKADLLAALGFDPERVRKQRVTALEKSKEPPPALFQRRGHDAMPEQYPNVYNASAGRAAGGAFVAGMKLLLPEGTERTDLRNWEKVSMPPAKQAGMRANERRKRVPISDFSDIGQLGFQGYKTLNRVQSFVYDTAYHTNENLLICAPTGAGKTNIAMMTVLRCVEQHVEMGVIKRDEFKIIYVAPMKALAAEMTRSFGKRLQPLGLSVKELTGDMQLTKAEILATNMLVTTPEKWDVVTRKSTGDVALTQLVKLLIIDEVHLLHDERGPVIESLVARTLRLVESQQSMIRIVGLSATLPNYLDAADFLKVNRYMGLFFFDNSFRPVPLHQNFIGVKAKNRFEQMNQMDDACYDVVIENLMNGHQVMVFVHARNATTKTAQRLREIAVRENNLAIFQNVEHPEYALAQKSIAKSPNKQLKEIFRDGFATHHAGMMRSDRTLVERYFEKGVVKVLCCTATLAWGVNLPAHAVVIKGTQLYNPEKGGFVDLGVLDVQQIFGRAGRPQFDTMGEATMITTHDKLSTYLSLMTHQTPIESRFIERLADHLNAEIALGTVTNIEEGMRWLSYTFLYPRLRKNPLAYGISHDEKLADPDLVQHRTTLIVKAAQVLDAARMVRFNEVNGYLHITDLGRVASHFYIKVESVQLFNEQMKQNMTEAAILSMISQSSEFDNIKVREEEMGELDGHLEEDCMLHPVKGGVENSHGKTNILLQTYITGTPFGSFSLSSDSNYVAQNAARLLRGLFEVAVKMNWPSMTYKLLSLCKTVDKRMWSWENPLRQFNFLDRGLLHKIQAAKLTVDKMRDMSAGDIGAMVRHVRMGSKIKSAVDEFPAIKLHATVQPITRTVLRVSLVIEPDFKWNARTHGRSEPWWIWVEDPENEHIYHAERYNMLQEHVTSRNEEERNQTLSFTIPIFEPLPSQYYIRAVSDRWIGAEAVEPISFQHLILPQEYPPHTELLDLQPLPITCLKDPKLISLFKHTHFNPIQTQVFHSLYHTDQNILLGAPTGSGKTMVAELAIFRVFREHPDTKVVYIAPLKALVKERILDWKVRFEKQLGKGLVELTGDVTPDMRAIERADVIVTTPEKWDGVSRSWQNRSYVKKVSLVVIDEIHLLGADRGPVLEVIVSRLNYISAHTTHKVRVVGLSTALANAHDLANWLGIKQSGLFNFRPSVRPVPLQIHVNGFPGKAYCPRMASMNKPTFQAIRTYSPVKPALVFVSSRRQTRLTALELISFVSAEENPKQWLRMPEDDAESLISTLRDENLKLVLSFGIGMHHAGLHEHDRRIVEELFCARKIQILVATSTLAWGVNMPAHLVVIKGTEFFDGKTKRYVDFPITDVMQMMGRAGRPQFDTEAVAVVFVHDVKKHFYKKFMFEPFPVESSLPDVLPDHFNAEVIGGTITSKQDAMDYLTWTYFFRRLVMNPTYYGLDAERPGKGEALPQRIVDDFLSRLVQDALCELEDSQCIALDEDGGVEPMIPGRISSYYYLSHLTMRTFTEELEEAMSLPEVLEVMSNAHEFSEVPCRHNEDILNEELAKQCPMPMDNISWDSSHTKTLVLLQAHFLQLPLPIADYKSDLKGVMDNCIRVLQGMVDLAADQGWLATALNIMQIVQMLIQARWYTDSSLLTLPNITDVQVSRLEKKFLITSLPEFMELASKKRESVRKVLEESMSRRDVEKVLQAAAGLPVIEVEMKVKGGEEDGALLVDEEYALEVQLSVRSGGARGGQFKPPRYGRPVSEGYWLVLGEAATGDLIAMKRLGGIRGRSTRATLSFFTEEDPGAFVYKLYIISDCYFGLDQEYEFPVHTVVGDDDQDGDEDGDE